MQNINKTEKGYINSYSPEFIKEFIKAICKNFPNVKILKANSLLKQMEQNPLTIPLQTINAMICPDLSAAVMETGASNKIFKPAILAAKLYRALEGVLKITNNLFPWLAILLLQISEDHYTVLCIEIEQRKCVFYYLNSLGEEKNYIEYDNAAINALKTFFVNNSKTLRTYEDRLIRHNLQVNPEDSGMMVCAFVELLINKRNIDYLSLLDFCLKKATQFNEVRAHQEKLLANSLEQRRRRDHKRKTLSSSDIPPLNESHKQRKILGDQNNPLPTAPMTELIRTKEDPQTNLPVNKDLSQKEILVKDNNNEYPIQQTAPIKAENDWQGFLNNYFSSPKAAFVEIEKYKQSQIENVQLRYKLLMSLMKYHYKCINFLKIKQEKFAWAGRIKEMEEIRTTFRELVIYEVDNTGYKIITGTTLAGVLTNIDCLTTDINTLWKDNKIELFVLGNFDSKTHELITKIDNLILLILSQYFDLAHQASLKEEMQDLFRPDKNSSATLEKKSIKTDDKVYSIKNLPTLFSENSTSHATSNPVEQANLLKEKAIDKNTSVEQSGETEKRTTKPEITSDKSNITTSPGLATKHSNSFFAENFADYLLYTDKQINKLLTLQLQHISNVRILAAQSPFVAECSNSCVEVLKEAVFNAFDTNIISLIPISTKRQLNSDNGRWIGVSVKSEEEIVVIKFIDPTGSVNTWGWTEENRAGRFDKTFVSCTDKDYIINNFLSKYKIPKNLLLSTNGEDFFKLLLDKLRPLIISEMKEHIKLRLVFNSEIQLKNADECAAFVIFDLVSEVTKKSLGKKTLEDLRIEHRALLTEEISTIPTLESTFNNALQ